MGLSGGPRSSIEYVLWLLLGTCCLYLGVAALELLFAGVLNRILVVRWSGITIPLS
jgi:hypothetical protein